MRPAVCHRCQRDLPAPSGAVGEDDRLLFCPFCAAPQLFLPAERTQAGPSEAGEAVPPPPHPGRSRPGQARQDAESAMDWSLALRYALLVAAAGAALTVAGLRVPAASFVGTLWVLGAPVLTLGLLARRRPDLPLDARAGLRVGVATGVLLVALLAASTALAGVVARFGLHGLAEMDAEIARQTEATRQAIAQRMREQGQSTDFAQHMLAFLASDEVRGGMTIAYAAVLGAIVLAFSAAGGAFAGMLHRARQVAARRAGL